MSCVLWCDWYLLCTVIMFAVVHSDHVIYDVFMHTCFVINMSWYTAFSCTYFLLCAHYIVSTPSQPS